MLAECYRVYRWSQMGEILSYGLEKVGLGDRYANVDEFGGKAVRLRIEVPSA